MLDAETVVSSGTMKITCSREELTQKLAIVSRGVSTRTAVQILGGILLNAEGGQLTLAATDMELSLRASLEAQVEGEGSVVVPGRLLVELARLLPETDVMIEQRADERLIRIAVEYVHGGGLSSSAGCGEPGAPYGRSRCAARNDFARRSLRVARR